MKWIDNKGDHLLANFVPPMEKDTIKRRKAGCAEKVDVSCPLAVIKYNKNMGGVDLMEQLKVCHELDR